MFIIRPVQLKDLDGLESCALTAARGIFNLPKNRELLEQKIRASLQSFSKQVQKPVDELYTFVLEETESRKICGTSGIFSRIGVNEAVYFYLIETVESQDMQVLKPATYSDEPSEICALFLLPDYRKGSWGAFFAKPPIIYSFPSSPLRKEHFCRNERNHRAITRLPFGKALAVDFLNIEFSELMDLEEKGEALSGHSA